MNDLLLRKSPLDSTPMKLVQIGTVKSPEWVPSRFNARTRSSDGNLIIWNTLTGAINVIEAKNRPIVERMLKKKGFSAELKGIVKYLHDRGFIVAKGTDEYRRLRVLAAQQQYRNDLLELIILPSEDCNFRCVYCYEDFSRGTMLPSVRQNIKKFVEKRIPDLNTLAVSWFGGEPLYGWEAVEELAPFFVEIAEKNDVTYGSHMTTNGYLLTPDVVDKLLSWKITDFQITLDGVEHHHDKKRPARDGQPTFNRIMSNLQAMHQRDDHFSVGIRVNYDRENLPYMEEFFTRLQQEFGGDRRFSSLLHAVGLWGGPNDATLPVCGVDDIGDIESQLSMSAASKGLNIGRGSLRNMAGAGKHVCYAARPYNLIIGADGTLMKCTIALNAQDYNIVGKLMDDGSLLIDPDKFAVWVELPYEVDQVCQKCYLLPGCQGMSCPMIRIEQNTQPCPAVKSNLHKELRTTFEIGKESARLSRVEQQSAAAG